MNCLVRPMTRQGAYRGGVDGRSLRCICGVVCLTVLLACASTPPAPVVLSAEAAEPPKPAAPATRPADASAAYHFMLGYQAELSQNAELALKEYQAALKADPAALSVKARLASLHFSLGDMPNALRYAEEVTDGQTDDARMLIHMAGILAGGGKGDKALSALDRAIEHLRHHGVAARLPGLVRQQVLLRDIGDIGGAVVLGQQVIERLVLVRPDLLRDRGQPFLGVVEHRVDVIDHAAERIDPVAHHVADLELRHAGGLRLGHAPLWPGPALWIKPRALLWSLVPFERNA